ncbi:MAG: hypothetical protein J3R72DRAFT_442950 [Linnemannia gamsii]|nr:MAG: hypothetical protein J3R72DRAFT_442950 [Linnemannia gamsii]
MFLKIATHTWTIRPFLFLCLMFLSFVPLSLCFHVFPHFTPLPSFYRSYQPNLNTIPSPYPLLGSCRVCLFVCLFCFHSFFSFCLCLLAFS